MKAVVDRIVQYANRYQLTNVETGEVLGTFDFEEVTGTVQQVGTEIDAELFQSIADDLAARVVSAGGELAGTIVTFSDISGTAANVASGDTSATLWGKVKNWFSRLKALAFKNKVAAGDFEAGAIKNADVAADAAIAQGKVNGLTTDYVASISASGRTVTYKNKNGVNMGTFTTQDTTYGIASQSSNGLMSSTDKTKLDGIESGAQKNTVLGVKGSSESAYRTGNVNITKANIGLDNVDNVRQYSTQNPPPYPVTSVNGKTGAVSLSASDVGAATSAQGTKADQAATDIANIKNGTTVVGAAGSVTATTLTSSDDLNDLTGAEHWGKIYYWRGGNNPKNSPPNASGGAVKIIRVGVSSTMQRGYSSSSSPSSSLPTSTQRSYNGSTWTDWEELMTSDGSYPTAKVGALALSAAVGSSAKPVYFSAGGVPVACGDELDVSVTGGAGYLPQVVCSIGTSNIGWWKVGEVPLSSVKISTSISIQFDINGVYADLGYPGVANSGKLEWEIRVNNGVFEYQQLSVFSGSIDSDSNLKEFCCAYDGASNKAILYVNLAASYRAYKITKTSEQGYSLGATQFLFAFTNTYSGSATAPSGAVYAVNRNVAAKGITPAADSDSDDVATTEWVNDALPHLYLHRITVTADGIVGAARFMWFSTSRTAYTLASLCRLIYSNDNERRIIPATGGWSGDSNRFYMTTYFRATSATTATVNGITQYISGNNLSHTSGWVDVESISDVVTQLF